MRALTPDETKQLERLRQGEERFIADRMPVMTNLAEALELQQPAMIVAEPERYLPSVELFMKDQEVLADDRASIVLRLGYLIGELLIGRLGGGVWMLNDMPETRTFLRYVVQFPRAALPGAMVDPFEVAASFIDAPVPRRLGSLVDDVAAALRG